MHSFDTSGLQPHLRAAQRVPKLERDAELELARAYAAGSRSAGNRLVEAHLRDVIAIAHGYRGYGLPLEDLIAEGNLGLVCALERFDVGRELRFMTYAGYWVRARMLAFVLRSWSVVSFGTSPLRSRLFFGLRRERTRLAANCVDEAELVAALAEHFGCSIARIEEASARLDATDVLFDTHEPEQGGPWDRSPEPANPETAYAMAEERSFVARRMLAIRDDMSSRERVIFEERLCEPDAPRSLTDMGRTFGVSRERVRQLEVRLKARLCAELAALAPPGFELAA